MHRRLSTPRICFALAVAGLTDAVQLLLGPLGWAFLDEILDVIAMAVISALIGFHMLLLPTFVIEMLPLADMLPTWTACTGTVILLRRKGQPPDSPLPTKMAKVTPAPPVIGPAPEGGDLQKN